MIKKKQSTSYTSSMQVYDSAENSGDTSKSRSQTEGGRGVSKDTIGVDNLGTQNRTRLSFGRLALACCSVKNMITLPKLTGYALLLFLGVISWMLFYPYDPIQFNQLPIPVLNDNNEVRQGENLVVAMNFEKSEGCEDIKATFFLIDGFVLQMTTSSVTRPVGQNDFKREIPIPTSAPVGDNRHIQIEYSCKPNPLRTIFYSWSTEHFTILPSSS